jgi:hypothetical protein
MSTPNSRSSSGGTTPFAAERLSSKSLSAIFDRRMKGLIASTVSLAVRRTGVSAQRRIEALEPHGKLS